MITLMVLTAIIGSYASIAASAIIAKFGGQFNKAEIEKLKKKLD